MTEAENIVTKVSRDLQQLNQIVKGNGTKKGSVLGRLDDIEETTKEISTKLNPLVEEHIMREKKRSWRIGDLANFIQLVVLVLLAWGMFVQ